MFTKAANKLFFLVLLFALTLFALTALSAPAWAAFPPLNITETDGSPSTYPYRVKFPINTVTDNGDGTVTLSLGTGNIIQIGDCTGPKCFTDGTNNTLIFEGSTDDDNEMRLVPDDYTSDRIITIPDRSGDMAVTTGTLTADRCVTIAAGGTLQAHTGECLSSGGGDVSWYGTSESGVQNYIAKFADGTGTQITRGGMSESVRQTDGSYNTTIPGVLTASGIVTTTTGMSYVTQGLTVNNGMGATALDRFIVKTNTISNAFYVDAPEDKIMAVAPLIATGLIATQTLTIPHSASLPASCAPGYIYQDTDAASGAQMYICESNSFVAVGSGDNVTVNGSAVDTTANFTNGDVVWTLVDGGAGGPDGITGTFAADSIDDTHINWGAGAGQVSCADMGTTDCGAVTSSAAVTGTGIIATTSMQMPYSANKTLDTPGQIGMDTTDDQLLYRGGGTRVIDYRQFKSVFIENPAVESFHLFRTPMAITVTNIHCITRTASSTVGIKLEECNSDYDLGTADCIGVDGATTILCDDDGAVDDGSLSNAGIDAGDWVGLNILSNTGTATGLTVTITYTVDAT